MYWWCVDVAALMKCTLFCSWSGDYCTVYSVWYRCYVSALERVHIELNVLWHYYCVQCICALLVLDCFCYHQARVTSLYIYWTACDRSVCINAPIPKSLYWWLAEGKAMLPTVARLFQLNFISAVLWWLFRDNMLRYCLPFIQQHWKYMRVLVKVCCSYCWHKTLQQ